MDNDQQVGVKDRTILGNGFSGGHSLLCYVVLCVQRVLYGGYLLLIWNLGNPLSRKKASSPNIQHPIDTYKRKPRLFQMMLNYLETFDLIVPYEGKLKTSIWHGVYLRYYILVKEECTHHNPVVQISSIFHVLYVCVCVCVYFWIPLLFLS